MRLKKVNLDQKGCEYQSARVAFPAGRTVEILNPDGILHNMHSYSKVNSPFNQAQPKFKKTLEVKIEKPETVEVKCDVHGWMQAGWLPPTPYVAVTDNSGDFKLTDVPLVAIPSKYGTKSSARARRRLPSKRRKTRK